MFNIIKAFVGANLISAGVSKAFGVDNIMSIGMDKLTPSFLNIGKSGTQEGQFSLFDTPSTRQTKGLAKKHTTKITGASTQAAKIESQQFPMGNNRNLGYALTNPKLMRFFKNINNYNIKDNRTIHLGSEEYLTKEDFIKINRTVT